MPRNNKNILILFLCFFLSEVSAQSLRKEYRFYQSIQVDGVKRTYLINLPPNYYLRNNFSLVIALHGGGGDAYQFEKSSLLTEKANNEKFIVVYPEGKFRNKLLPIRTWNAGSCCAYSVEANVDDVKFISVLIDTLIHSYKINSRKVYATGHSNGGMMCYRLACELSEKIAAIAPNSSTMVVTVPCNPLRAMPILHMHSILDENVPYDGGVVLRTGSPSPALDSVFGVWSTINNCTQKDTLRNDSLYREVVWSNANNTVAINYYLTMDGGHSWPGGKSGSSIGDQPSKVINANDLLWEFFKQYQLPTVQKNQSTRGVYTAAY